MAFDIQLRDEAGRTVVELWVGNERSYVLPDGSRCTVPQSAAWCRDCQTYVVAETIPAMGHLEERLRALSAGRERFTAWAQARGESLSVYWLTDGWDNFHQMELKNVNELRKWRLLRRSPPRCLTCFSTEIELIPDEDFTYHPLTGQRLTLHGTSHMSLLHRWTYSPEGLPFEVPPDGRSGI